MAGGSPEPIGRWWPGFRRRSPRNDEPTRSKNRRPASLPLVAQMLGALDAEPGMRVLEIGTGTGYNAALLAHRLGAEQVVSMEVDPAVAEHARRALDHVGFGAVTVVTGDGANGYEPGAPYDRVLATVAVAEVPPAWVVQTRPGGLVITPWGTPFYPGGCSR